MYSFSYLEPVCCSMCSSNCCFLTCIQVSQEAGQVVWYYHLFQNFPQFVELVVAGKLEGLILKLKLQYFWPHDTNSQLIGKDSNAGKKLKAGGEGGSRGQDGWITSPTQWTWVWANSGRQWRTGKPGVLQSMGSQSQTRCSNWTTTKCKNKTKLSFETFALFPVA